MLCADDLVLSAESEDDDYVQIFEMWTNRMETKLTGLETKHKKSTVKYVAK